MKVSKKLHGLTGDLSILECPQVYWTDEPARILVVDDEEGIRDALKEFLKSLGYLVFSSSDPFQALEIINGQFIHIVILDLFLPCMDGIELQKRISRLSPDTMQIIMTGYESLDSAIKTLKAGAYDYLQKPVSLPYLENIVLNCLQQQRLEMENRRLINGLNQTCEQLKEREAALKAKVDEANYYMDNTLEKAGDIIFTMDTEGRFTYINSRIDAFGYNKKELIGAFFYSILSEIGHAEKTDIDGRIKTGKAGNWQVSIRETPFGYNRLMTLSISPLHDDRHILIGALGIVREIDDKKGRIARQGEKIQKDIEFQRKSAMESGKSYEEIREILRVEKENSMLQLASGIAHEVRNPLSIIHGSIQFLNSTIGTGNDAVLEHLDVMAENCGFLESIINELLHFAKPGPTIFHPADINACVEKVVSLTKGRCTRQNIEVGLDLDTQIPATAFDAQKMGQAFINIIMNAVQTMPNGGTLTITTQNDPLQKRINILFQDTGSGIEDRHLDRIFDPFFSTKSKGIGLGLSVTKHIVEAHNGRIWATSRTGKGAQFHIQLPLRYSETE
ncbi:response regulator [bacterium]|nr:response regulator [bacterium]